MLLRALAAGQRQCLLFMAFEKLLQAANTTALSSGCAAS